MEIDLELPSGQEDKFNTGSKTNHDGVDVPDGIHVGEDVYNRWHALLILQISSVSNIPSHYILKHWTKDPKIGQTIDEVSNGLHCGVQRFNDLCKRAIKLSEEGKPLILRFRHFLCVTYCSRYFVFYNLL